MNDEERKLVAEIIKNLVSLNNRLGNIEKILTDVTMPKIEIKGVINGDDLPFGPFERKG